MYDINLFALKLHQGQQEITPTGFTASAPPRRAARSRSEDILIASLSFGGDERIEKEDYDSWMDTLVQSFYKTSGSVTSAMRSIIETLNLTLMEINLKSPRDGGSIVGMINLVALHHKVLYIAQSGQTHAFILNESGLAHYYDTSGSDRGMGLSRSPDIRYYQADIGRGSYFFAAATPPDTWTEDLLFVAGFPKLEQLRRRLLNQAPQEFRLDLAEIKPGEGQICIQKPQITPEESKIPSNNLPDDTAAPAEKVTEAGEGDSFDTREIAPVPTISEDQPEEQPVEMDEDDIAEAHQLEEIEMTSEVLDDQTSDELMAPKEPSDQGEKEAVLSREKPKKRNKEKSQKRFLARREHVKQRSLKGMAVMLSRWRSLNDKVGTFFRDLISRWAPKDSHGVPQLSKGTLLLIAIIVPLVMTGIAASVYFTRGRTSQYAYYFEQAQLSASLAKAINDPIQAHDAWNQTLAYLDQAEAYKETDEILVLREQVQDTLDMLDGVVRVDYQPAIIGQFYSEINISNIISYGPDLYMLDAAGGRVIHADRGSQGYDIDPDFVCAEGNYSGGRIDLLVDMVSLPINNPYQAHILAVDAMGNVAYCAPGQNPIVQTLPSLEGSRGGITHIAYDSNYLYVLNPSYRSVMVYRPTNGQFLEAPTDFFENLDEAEVPDLSLVVDMAVNGPELYLLQGDGTLIDCTSRGVAGIPVSCENPVSYIDGRPGKEEVPFLMPESDYSVILYTTPPDPSISILDTQNADIYRFSLRFRLYERLRPDMGNFEVESATATAFTIGIDQMAFIAFGHQVFYAYVE